MIRNNKGFQMWARMMKRYPDFPFLMRYNWQVAIPTNKGEKMIKTSF